MTTHVKEEKYQITAQADLSAASAMHHAIGLISGTITALPREAIGVLKSNGLSGNNVAVCYQGITKVAVGAAVGSAGAPLTVTTSGWFTGATSGMYTVGRSLASAVSGDIMPAIVDFSNIQYLAT